MLFLTKVVIFAKQMFANSLSCFFILASTVLAITSNLTSISWSIILRFFINSFMPTIVLNIAFFLLSNLRSCLRRLDVHDWSLNLDFFMRMSCFRRKVALATFVSFFVELKKFGLKLIRELDLGWTIKTDLFLNLFMIRRRLSELFENTSNIFKFSRAALGITTDVLFDLTARVFYEDSVVVCWLTINEIKNDASARYFCICVFVTLFWPALNIASLVIFILNASAICGRYLR